MEGWQIGVAFVTRRASGELHAAHFGDSTPTDCMTFPLRNSCGEVAICPAIAQEHVAAHGGDVYEEVSLYLVHTCLHLIGYRDDTPAARGAMRKKEKTCMRYLQEHTCILSPLS